MPTKPACLYLMSHTKFRSRQVTLHFSQAVGTPKPLNFHPTKAQKCHLVSKSPGTTAFFAGAPLFQGQQHLHSSYWQRWGSALGGEFVDTWNQYVRNTGFSGVCPKQPGRSRSSVSALWAIVVTTTSLPALRGPFYSKGERSCK